MKLLMLSILLGLSVSCAGDPNAQFDLESLSAKEAADFNKAKVILLGELHDNPNHHDIQNDILNTLGEQGRLKTVIFEQVDWTNQGSLSQLTLDNMDKLPKKLDWEKSGWPAYDMYEPLFETAVRYRARLIAGGLPKKHIEMLYKMGYESAFSAAEIERIKLRTPLDENAQALLRKEIYEGHCKMISEDQAEKMIPVQRARDAALVKGYLQAADLTGVTVFILGNGHARKEFGVPSLLSSIDPKLKIWSAGMQEVGSEPFPPQAFDKVWVSQKVKRDDPCFAMKKHMDSKQAGEGAAASPAPAEGAEPAVERAVPSAESSPESPAGEVQDSETEETSVDGK